MKTKFESKLLAACLFLFAAVSFTACTSGGDKKNDKGNAEHKDSMHADHGTDANGSDANGAEGNGSSDAGSADAGTTDGAASYEEGSLGYSITQWVSTDETTQAFTLDAINWDGDEVSAEGRAQLDMVAAILEANSNLKAEIQGHTNKKKNAVADKAAKGVTAARALWTKGKLVIGHDAVGSRISTKGYGSEQPQEGMAPEDEAQKRIVILFSK